MADIEALRARMREAAEKAMAATSDNWFHGEYSDIEYAPPAGDENGAHWFPLADELAPAVCDYLIAAQPSATIAIDAYTTRLRDDLDRVTRERDEARKQVNGLRLSQSLDKDSAYVIRELLNRHNVPAAAFVDDHVANAIAQRDAAEAALSAANARAERMRELIVWAHDTLTEINVLNYDYDDVCRLNDASVEVILGLKDATLTKEPTDVG